MNRREGARQGASANRVVQGPGPICRQSLGRVSMVSYAARADLRAAQFDPVIARTATESMEIDGRRRHDPRSYIGARRIALTLHMPFDMAAFTPNLPNQHMPSCFNVFYYSTLA